MITTEVSRIEYTGDGVTTTFPYTWKTFVDSHLKVYKGSALQALNTDYTVTGVGTDAGGNVVFGTAPASGVKIVIFRDPPLKQETDWIDYGAFRAESLEKDLDRVVTQVQRLRGMLSKAPLLADYQLGKDVIIDTPQAGKILGWSADGKSIINYDIPGGVSSDVEVAVFKDAVRVGSVGRRLNLLGVDFGITEDVVNDWFSLTIKRNVANALAGLDGSGLLYLAQIPSVLTGKDADTVDTYHASALEKVANKGIASGYCDLDASVLIPIARMGTGVSGASKYLRGDRSWQIPLWSEIDKTVSSLADITTKSHTVLSDIGTNTHPQIDTHLGASSGIHGITGSVVGTTDAQTLTSKILSLVKIKDENAIPVGNVLLKVLDQRLKIRNAGDTANVGLERAFLDFGSGLVNADIATGAGIIEAKLSLNYATHSPANDPTADEKGALAGTNGVPSGTNKYLTNSDPRNTDARTPAGTAGGDLAGTYPNPTVALLAITDGKVATANKDGLVGTPCLRTLGTGAQQACAGNDSRLSDARTPTAHASTHNGGADPVTPSGIGAIAIPGSSAWGDILFRNTSGWTRLPAGTSGLLLKTQGAGADPVWVDHNVASGIHGVTGSLVGTTDTQTLTNKTFGSDTIVKEKGTADAINTVYDSYDLILRSSSWRSGVEVKRNWSIRNVGHTTTDYLRFVAPDATVPFELSQSAVSANLHITKSHATEIQEEYVIGGVRKFLFDIYGQSVLTAYNPLYIYGDNTQRLLLDSTGSTFYGDVFLSNGYLKPANVSLPTAGSTYRGKIARVEGATGVADACYICRKKANDTYEWAVMDYHTYLIYFGSNSPDGNALSPGSTIYLGPMGQSSNQTYAELLTTIDGIITNMWCHLAGAPGGSETITFTIMKNGVATSMTLTISGANTEATTTANPVTVAAGDKLSVKAVASAGAAATQPRGTLKLEAK